MPETRPRGFAGLVGAQAARVLVGTGAGGGLIPTVLRLAAQAGDAATVTTRHTEGASDTEQFTGQHSGDVSEVTLTVPGAAAKQFSLYVVGDIDTSTFGGTMTLRINDRPTSGSFASGAGGGTVPGIAIVSGGDPIVLQLIPTFTGGGTVDTSITYGVSPVES